MGQGKRQLSKSPPVRSDAAAGVAALEAGTASLTIGNTWVTLVPKLEL